MTWTLAGFHSELLLLGLTSILFYFFGSFKDTLLFFFFLTWLRATDCTFAMVEDITAVCCKGLNRTVVSHCRNIACREFYEALERLRHAKQWRQKISRGWWTVSPPMLCSVPVTMNVCILYWQTWAKINYSKTFHGNIASYFLCVSGFDKCSCFQRGSSSFNLPFE